ncbi:MAG: periplasmic heavy metal sensor [Labilibaculum sp.]|nr:periplasmic heavy metal sensor [Labilibaculum sp.]MBI9056834.1 periplasmic heavy metal sensor [Labilibaculum sp.]
MKEIYANADKISELKNQIKKEEIGMKLDIRSFLTEEQQMKMAKHSKHRKGVMRDKKGQMGQANRAEMGRAKQGMRKGDRGEQQGKKGYGIKQKAGKQMGKDRNMLGLSDEQKAQMKEIRVAHLKETKELKNELEVIRLKQKHLMTAEKVDKNSIMDNVDRLSNIQNQLAKKQIDNKMEIREILTEDQLVLFMSHPKGKKGFAKRHKRMN